VFLRCIPSDWFLGRALKNSKACRGDATGSSLMFSGLPIAVAHPREGIFSGQPWETSPFWSRFSALAVDTRIYPTFSTAFHLTSHISLYRMPFVHVGHLSLLPRLGTSPT